MKYEHGERIELHWDDGHADPADPQYIKGHVTDSAASCVEFADWHPNEHDIED